MAARLLILASGSPRRREFLERLGLEFEVRPADIDETPLPNEAPNDHVLRLAKEKARVISEGLPEALVIAADTIVVVDGEIVGKPSDDADARRILTRLSGREHQVVTGVATDGLSGTARRTLLRETTIRFRAVSAEEIAWYVATGEPADKSGAYGFQGIGTFMVESVSGSPSNVAGLPVTDTVALLRELGFPLPWSQR